MIIRAFDSQGSRQVEGTGCTKAQSGMTLDLLRGAQSTRQKRRLKRKERDRSEGLGCHELIYIYSFGGGI